MEENKSFRTSVFGGFDRQDVLDYITRTAKAQGDQVAALEKALDEAKAQLQQQTEQISQLQSELEQARQAAQNAQQSAQEREQEQAALQEQLQGYERLKSDYASIELDARQRASLILAQAETDAQARQSDLVSQAEGQAERILSQAQDEVRHIQEERRQLLSRTRRDFDSGSQDLNATVSIALREVDKVRQQLLDLRSTFEENAHAVDDLCGEEA